MPDPDEFETDEDDPFSGDPEAEFEEKSREIEEAQKEIDKINADLAIEAAKTGADIAGMFDPTPISDLISGGISLKQGEFAEAGLSLASCIPYIGDLVAKPVKASKIAAKIAKLTARLRKQRDRLEKLKNLLKRLEKRIAKGKGKRIEKPPKAQGGGHVKGKPKKEKKRLPQSRGKWQGEPGNSPWKSDVPEVNKITKDKPIPFKDGHPDFSEWSKGEIKFEKGTLKGTNDDFGMVYEEVAKIKDLPNKTAAKNYLSEMGLTPHHMPDGQTIQFVPTDLHSNIPHIGGASSLRNTP